MPEYTLRAKEPVILQSQEDRAIDAEAEALTPNPVLPGVSSVTGLPLAQGVPYQPMLAVISTGSATVTVDGKATTGVGLGKRAPWGVQYADIVYESLMFRAGETRMIFLFSDSFAQDEPTSVGPVRSVRIGYSLLNEEWQGGIAYMGSPNWEESGVYQAFEALGTRPKGIRFNLLKSWLNFRRRVPNVKAPSNMDVNIAGLRACIDPMEAVPRPFLFADGELAHGYEAASAVYLDWGRKNYRSRFVYHEADGLYQRYSGNAPYRTFLSADNRDEAAMMDMCFANVIIQRMVYEYPDDNPLRPVMQSVGKGNADIFIAGRYIPGYWVRETVASPTVFLDDQGKELRLSRGKTYIAHFPNEAPLGYGAQ